MNLQPFVNRGGKRVVRWPRLVLVWGFVTLGTLLGSCAMGYILMGDWRKFDWLGICLGVMWSASLTMYGFTAPIDKLSPVKTDAVPGE